MLYSLGLFVLLWYALFTLMLWKGWDRLRERSDLISENNAQNLPLVSVIIPVRNEAEHIGALLDALDKQCYPHDRYEVWVIDDASTDSTTSIVLDLQKKVSYRLQLESLLDDRTVISPKKRAITHAISLTNGALTVCTDGDCTVGAEWLATMVSYFIATDAQFISSPVRYTPPSTIWEHFMTVELASLVGAGAATLAFNHPTMCNGANIAYRKSAFEDIGGYTLTPPVASGDDEFLMHAIQKKYPNAVHFLKSSASIVDTQPPPNWRSFEAQRRRWASKWKHYSSLTPKLVAVFVFLSNFIVLVGLVGWGLGQLDGHQLALLWLLKCLPEFIFLAQILRFLDREKSIVYIPLLQLVYPLYVSFFGLAAQHSSFYWKGRKLH